MKKLEMDISESSDNIVEEKYSKKKPMSRLEHLELFGNTVNHGLIAITTFYITWYAFYKVGFNEYQSYHAWFTTIGYQLFMSEGILALYNKNTFTMSINSRRYKIRVHWVLQAIASGFALYGIPFQIYKRQVTNRKHFGNTHGVVGLISGIFLILTILSGCSALFSNELKRYIKPFFSKVAHNFLSCVCYVCGMIAIISAYYTRSWVSKADPGEVRFIMMWLLSFITALTMIGPLKAFYYQFKNK